MAPVTVNLLTVDDARARRAEIVALVGGDESAFRDRAESYLLSAEELALFDELENLDFLLSR